MTGASATGRERSSALLPGVGDPPLACQCVAALREPPLGAGEEALRLCGISAFERESAIASEVR
ncbi:hypothetical protein trd_0319 [Thermomicrobium roseum DSM 5159]|uniref:Uncharacterized protein n=1 Tax=Thermomicrobium roseum (strain ATCC 27502 / DSM 5159 / P-2) TaxID=309801 RepID=B9KXX7_THERP|nr:hypothetical protein trd_0319 [Thermomicrobium roseum DSM 5159]